MNKFFGIVIVVVIVIFVYLILAVTMPAINEISTAAAVSLNATSNMSNYPGTLEVVESSPWWMWALPGAVGMVVIIVMLKKGG